MKRKKQKLNKEFDLIYKVSEDDYIIGLVYPDEQNSTSKKEKFELWIAKPHFNPKETNYETFLFDDVEDAYYWDKLSSPEKALENFFKWIYDDLIINSNDMIDIPKFSNITEIIKNAPLRKVVMIDAIDINGKRI